MRFHREPKTENNPDLTQHSVYMVDASGRGHYICDMIDGDTPEALAVNTLGLTLRARLTRSKGAYAMLEGEVFNPNRLLDAACTVTDYTVEPFKGDVYKDGYTLLTVNADGCVNKYLIFTDSLLRALERSLKKMKQ